MANVLRVETTTAKGPMVPFQTALAVPPIAQPFGVAPLPAAAVFSGTCTITVPVIAQGASTQQSTSLFLTSFPQTLSGAGIVVVSVALSGLVPGVLVGMPALTLTFGSGSALGSGANATATFALQSGRTYRSPGVSVQIVALALAPIINPAQVGILVQAVLYATP